MIIDFGELGDACSYHGRTYAGVVTIDLELAADEVIVHHQYAALRTEQLQLDGEVDVTWAGGARRVVSDLEFEHEDDEGETRSLAVQADRTLTLDDDTIAVTIIGPRRERVFEVTTAGEVSE